VTRSRQYGKGDRIQGAVRRAHAAMVEWYTRSDIRDKVVAIAEKANQPRPYMHVGKRPAPVAHFISVKDRSRANYCKGHHVISADCD
jgi:hypothetical protein